jgi:hypothetical protein
MKVIKKKVSNFIKMLSIKQLYFTAVLPLSIIGYILCAFFPHYCIFRPECLLSPDKKHTYLGNAKRYYE